MDHKSSVLTVDDDEAMGKVLGALLTQAGLRALHVSSGKAAMLAMERDAFDLVISDVRMPNMDGMELLSQLVSRWPEVPVIMLTAHGTVPLAVDAMRAGAVDFVLKPFDREELIYVVQKALTATRRQASAAPNPKPASSFIGTSAAMNEVQALVARAAPTDSTVLLLGESGTGKELVARAIHDKSPRRGKPLVKLNCGALPDNLLESELFGYEKGAFTGAVTRKPGRVELAEGGTLFLDEVGDVTPHMQVKLLRVLQERQFERLGGTVTINANVRFVAATHRDLADLVARGQFREDLYYRLNVVPIRLPSLRSRPEDIAPLARQFTLEHAKNLGTDVELAPDAIAALERAPWPGNVRQLQNFIERLVVLSDGPVIGARDVERQLPPRPSQAPASDERSLGAALQETERETIRNALARANGNRTVAARILGVSRRALYYKLEEYDIK